MVRSGVAQARPTSTFCAGATRTREAGTAGRFPAEKRGASHDRAQTEQFMQTQRFVGLVGFLDAVERYVDEAILAGCFDSSQRQQLLAAASQYRPRTHRNPLGDPLAVFYLIARAHRDELDEQALELGSFCQFYLLALDLLDDVQDNDLTGKPHAGVGAGMAVNDALTLLFLGLSALERCMRLEKSPQRRMLYLKIVNRVALTTGRGQHLDLMGESGARTPQEVLEMQRQKTAPENRELDARVRVRGALRGRE
jgi:hypothetical protein